ncbi:biotin transporter BioY, partial [bacterium]|nr:biotin transporter BioY [bacterium]
MSIDDSLLKQFIAVTIFSLLTAAGAWIEIPLPFTPVPISLQTLFVILAGASLGAKRGALSQIMYLFYGICGLPVFAGGA